MESRRLPSLTRQLIKACGGIDEASTACCLKRSRLGECQIPGSGAFLPIDVVAALEQYCGEPIISRALVEARPAYVHTAGLLTEALDTAEEASCLQRLVRKATAAGGGRLSAADRRAIEEELARVRGHAEAAEAALAESGT